MAAAPRRDPLAELSLRNLPARSAVPRQKAGSTLAWTLPGDHSAEWGAAAGFVIGFINVGVIGRSFPAISGLPLVPQLADNVMFGTVFAAVLDRRDRQRDDPGGTGNS